MSQRLDERPLAVDRLLQQLRLQAAGAFDGLSPQPLDDIPRLAEPSRVCRAHLDPIRIAPVEFGVDQGPDVDAVDGHVHDLAVDVDVDQFYAPHDDAAQVDPAELGAGEIDGAQLCPAEVNTFEPGPAQIGTNEISHATTLTSRGDNAPSVRGVRWRTGQLDSLGRDQEPVTEQDRVEC